jgi:triphosphoribosyl-dephospho-CoA synthetase
MTPLQIAAEAWGADMPDWVRAMAVACERTSQAKVAKAIDRSGAVISNILRNKYAANTAHIEERVRGVFLDGRVMCPALGELPVNECQDWRQKAKEFALTNSQRARMYRACGRCPRNRKDHVE